MLNFVLSKITLPLMKRNCKFRNKHKGESCYIFGNGVSIKDMDLSCFGDKVSFGCNYLFFHKDFDKLQVKYYTEPPPYWYFNIWKKGSGASWRVNKLSLLQRRVQRKFNSINYFVNLSNFPVLFGKNIYYIHHFGKDSPDHGEFDLSEGVFYTGALHSMINMAIYMGFKKAYLIGCDYTHSPQRILHFYEKGKGSVKYDDEYNKKYFKVVESKISLVAITNSNAISKTLDHISYKDFTEKDEIYHENNVLVDRKILEILDDWGGYKIY